LDLGGIRDYRKIVNYIFKEENKYRPIIIILLKVFLSNT